MSEVLRVEQREATVELTLNRPRARNALSRELIARLTDEMRRAGIAPEVRSVIVTGAPPAFCAGTKSLSMFLATVPLERCL